MRMFILCAMVLMVMACGNEMPDAGTIDNDTVEVPEAEAQYVADGELELTGTVGGFIGDVGEFNVDAFEGEFAENDYRSWADLFVTFPNGDYGMARLAMVNGLRIGTIQPGNHIFNGDADVAGVLCYGPSMGSWLYDDMADEVVLAIEDDDLGTRVVDYSFQFNDLEGNPTNHVSGRMILTH